MQQVTAWVLAVAGLAIFGAGIYFMRFSAICGPDESGIECLRSWVSAIGPLIAGAALLIAFAQYSLSEDTRNRQLRAYVTLVGGGVSPAIVDGVDGIMVQTELKNSGSTPGYEFITWIEQPMVLPEDREPFTLASSNPPNGKSIIAPATNVWMTRFYAWKENELQEVIDRKKAIFIWGGANYEDAFGKKRRFYFRIKVNGQRDPRGIWALAPHKLGYEAD